MAGLGLLLDAQGNRRGPGKHGPQIISKTLVLKPLPSDHATSFLEACNHCRKRLSPDNDIYMYRGDGAFCSEECRERQIFMDEERSWKEKCSLSAAAPSTSPSSRSANRSEVVGEKRAGTGAKLFAY